MGGLDILPKTTMKRKEGASVTARITIPQEFLSFWENLPSGGRTTLLTNLVTRLFEQAVVDENIIGLVMMDTLKGDSKWIYTVR